MAYNAFVMKHAPAMAFLACALLSGCGDEDESGLSLARQQGDHGWGPDRCPAVPEGVEVGYDRFDQIGPLALKTCGGEDVTLADVCGADAAWLFLAHMWCPSCRVVGEMSEGIHDSFAGENLASLNVIVEDSQGERPDEEDCLAWRETFAQDDVITLFDPTGDAFVLWDDPVTSLNIVLDRQRVMMAKFHGDRDRDILAAIDARLHE
jgi:hypothetical protein